MLELGLIVLSLLLVAGCGMFVAAEFSFIAVNRSQVEKLASDGDGQAQGLLKALQSLSTQLSGAQVGITVTNLAIGFLAQPAIASLLAGPLENIGFSVMLADTVSLIIGIFIATVVTMVFGEHLPKNLAIARPMATAKKVQATQRGFSKLMHIPIVVLNGSANWLLRRLGVVPQEELASARTSDELSSLVRRSADQGTLDRGTADMVQRGLSFGELTALDVMTPRVRMRTVDIDHPIAHVLLLAHRTGLSRFPVLKRGVDDIAGIIHVKQVVAHGRSKRHHVRVGDIMHKPTIVPSSIQLEPLLAILRESTDQMAICIDEFGGTDGLVTMEDLIEELVGEVRDEHDRSKDTAIRFSSDGIWSVSGLLRPDEVGKRLNLVLPENEETETLGGLLIDVLGKVPVAGDDIELEVPDAMGDLQRLTLRVERMDGRRVDRLSATISPLEDGKVQ